MYEIVVLTAVLIGILWMTQVREKMEPGATTTPPTDTPTDTTTPLLQPEGMPSQVRDAMEYYRKNYIEYRTTGNAAFKTAYQVADQYIAEYFNELRSRLKKDSEYVNTFLDKYGTTHSDLNQLQGQMQNIRTEGPKLEDKYITIKREEEEIPEDYTQYYIKGAVLAGIVGIIVAVSFF